MSLGWRLASITWRIVGYFLKFAVCSPSQLMYYGFSSGVFVHWFALWGPTHFTHLNSKLQCRLECPYLWQLKHYPGVFDLYLSTLIAM